MRSRAAFTLIELLIVLAIIGVLMAIGIPIYTGYVAKAKIQQVATNIQLLTQSIIQAAAIGTLEEYEDSNGNIDVSRLVKGIDATKYSAVHSGNSVDIKFDNSSDKVDLNEVGNKVTCDSTSINGDIFTCTINLE